MKADPGPRIYFSIFPIGYSIFEQKRRVVLFENEEQRSCRFKKQRQIRW